MGRKVSDGQSVRVTVPQNTEIKQGELVYLEGYLGMAARGVKTGANETASLILNVEPGEFETSQVVDDQDMDVGTDLFWDNTAKKLTETPTTVFAGKVTAERDANDVIWFKLAPQLPVGTDAATLAAAVGNLESLETTAKSSIVGAINEVKAVADAALNTPAAVQEDSTADDVAGVVADLNALLAKLKAAGLMETE